MPLKDITDHIHADSKVAGRRLEAEAERAAAGLIDQAKEDARAYVIDVVEKARRQGLNKKKQKLAAAALAARDSVIATKQELIDEAFSRAQAVLEGLDGDRYIDILVTLLAANASGGEEVIFDDADAPIAPKAVAKANNLLAAAGGPPVMVADDKRPLGQGFVLRRGRVEESFAFSVLLKTARDELEADIAEIIFGGRG